MRASSATGWSLVPAETTATRPPTGGHASPPSSTMARADAWYAALGWAARTASKTSGPARVARMVDPWLGHAAEDGHDLLDGLALAEDDLGEPAPQAPVVVEFGEAEVLKRHVAEALGGLLRRDLARLHGLQEFAQRFLVHGSISCPSAEVRIID